MCLAVASYGSSDRIKIYMCLCAETRRKGVERGVGEGLDESIEEGARLEESCHSPEIGSRDEEIKYRGGG